MVNTAAACALVLCLFLAKLAVGQGQGSLTTLNARECLTKYGRHAAVPLPTYIAPDGPLKGSNLTVTVSVSRTSTSTSTFTTTTTTSLISTSTSSRLRPRSKLAQETPVARAIRSGLAPSRFSRFRADTMDLGNRGRHGTLDQVDMIRTESSETMEWPMGGEELDDQDGCQASTETYEEFAGAEEHNYEPNPENVDQEGMASGQCQGDGSASSRDNNGDGQVPEGDCQEYRNGDGEAEEGVVDDPYEEEEEEMQSEPKKKKKHRHKVYPKHPTYGYDETPKPCYPNAVICRSIVLLGTRIEITASATTTTTATTIMTSTVTSTVISGP